jgi:hypothetical protein
VVRVELEARWGCSGGPQWLCQKAASAGGFPLHHNQRYRTFACFIGARCAYARLQNKFDINVQTFADFSSLDIGEIVSYAGITVWTRFHEHRVQNAAVASISLVAVVTCLSQVSVRRDRCLV